MRKLVHVLFLVLMACSSGPGGTDLHFGELADPDALEALEGIGEDLVLHEGPPPDGQACWPGEPKGCSSDGQGLVVCVPDGSGWAVEECLSEGGGPGACLNGACTRCLPGERYCEGEDQVWQCDESGLERVLTQDCAGEQTGQVCWNGACARLCDLSIKWNTYMGCDYWGADLDNAFVSGGEEGYYDAQGSQFAIVVSNPHQRFPATVSIWKWEDGQEVEQTLDSHDQLFDTEPILPGGLRIFNLPRRDVNGTEQAPKAWHVKSSIPITAYQFNPLENVHVFSNDASLLLPINVLGNYYVVMTREQTFDELRSYLTVLAVYGGETHVSITVTAPTTVGQGFDHLEPGDTISRTLHYYDVLNIESSVIGTDMTGSVVLADRPVVVFGGSEAANAPNTNHCGADGFCVWDGTTPCEANQDCIEFNTCCADHLEEQLFPVKTWGKQYLCAKSFDRGDEKDVWRIIASEDGTQVTTVPVQADIPVLNRHEWYEFESDEHFLLAAKKPVMVGQFYASEDAPNPGKQPGDAKTGDPSFVLVVPSEQFRSDYVFLAPDKYKYDYATVIAPATSAVVFDGAPLAGDEWEKLGDGKQWRVARFPIADGTHTLSADQPVGVYVYGYDQYVSYGYPAGLDLRPINPEGEQP
jgi:hypothetical protein